MASEVKTAKENVGKNAEKPNFLKRFGRGVANFFKKIGRFFLNMKHELKKVTWPTRKQVINYSLVVFAFIVIMIVIIGLFDLGASALITRILNI